MDQILKKSEKSIFQGNGFFDKLSINNRVNLLIILTTLFFFIFSTSYFMWSLNKSMFDQKAKQTESITEIAVDILKGYDQEVKEGKLTLKDAQEKAKKRLSSVRYGKTNYIWINDYNGVMLMHPIKPELNGKNVLGIKDSHGKFLFREFVKIAKEKNKGLTQYYWPKPGQNKNKSFEKYTYIRGFSDWNWVVGTGVYVDDIQSEFSNIIVKNLGLNIIILILATIIGNLTIGKSIVKPVQDLTQLSLKLAEKDLTVEIPDDNNKTEIGDLNRSFKRFKENFTDLIKQVTKSAEEIAASSQQMSASSEQTAQGAKQTATSTSQLAQGTQEISRNVEDGASNINKMNKAIQGVSEEAKQVAKLGNETETNANAGAEHVKKAVNKIDSIKKVSEDISVNISELGQLSSEIEQIVDLIKNIAGQTNLLALNAAIEAARAGEHGKGFAVVADEVKKLAGQSAGATEKITGMIKEIQNKTNFAVTTMDKATHEVEEGVFVINDAGKALENIISQVKTANQKIQGITKEIDSVAKNSEEMVQMIENISAITEQTAAGAEEISSITEEQTTNLEEISSSAQTLASVAEKLIYQVSVIKI